MHREDVHQPAAPAPTTPAPVKIERLPRPVFSLNMSEAAWQFKVIKWRSYINQTPLTPDEKLQQLRAACDEELSQRVYDSGDYNALDTENQFLARMKELAVMKIHKSVHLNNLYRMAQDSDEDEAINAFVALASPPRKGATLTSPTRTTSSRGFSAAPAVASWRL